MIEEIIKHVVIITCTIISTEIIIRLLNKKFFIKITDLLNKIFQLFKRQVSDYSKQRILKIYSYKLALYSVRFLIFLFLSLLPIFIGLYVFSYETNFFFSILNMNLVIEISLISLFYFILRIKINE